MAEGLIVLQSLGGAVAMGAHGSGLKHGCISDSVVGVDLVNHQGDLISISPTENPEMMNAARVCVCAGIALNEYWCIVEPGMLGSDIFSHTAVRASLQPAL